MNVFGAPLVTTDQSVDRLLRAGLQREMERIARDR